MYCGHNEFLEERSYDATAINKGPLESLASSSLLVAEIRKRILRPDVAANRLTPDAQTRLDLNNGMKRYVRDAAWRTAVEQHYRLTMRRMIMACRKADVPLVVCIPASDLVNTPPFKVTLASGIDEQAFKDAWSIAQSGQATSAERLDACRRCLALDPLHAGAHYIAGTLWWHQQQTSLARRHLIAARDHDVCPLRATSSMVDQLRKLVSDSGVRFVDCPRLFDQSDSYGRPLPDGIEDPEWFVDHIHPTIRGHQRIAAAVADQFIRLLDLDQPDHADTEYERLVQQHLETLDETYFNRAKQRLEGLRNWAAGRAGENH